MRSCEASLFDSFHADLKDEAERRMEAQRQDRVRHALRQIPGEGP